MPVYQPPSNNRGIGGAPAYQPPEDDEDLFSNEDQENDEMDDAEFERQMAQQAKKGFRGSVLAEKSYWTALGGILCLSKHTSLESRYESRSESRYSCE